MKNYIGENRYKYFSDRILRINISSYKYVKNNKYITTIGKVKIY